MKNWNDIIGDGYFNLDLKERAKFYTDTLIINPTDNFNNPQFLEKYYNRIIKTLFEGITTNKSIQQISSDLGHLTKVWAIDWRWIIHHIILDYSNIIRAKDILKNYGEDAKVYKYTTNGDCISCKKLYLKNLDNGEPRTFKLSELVKNGHNLKFNIEILKPVVGATIFGYEDKIESFPWDFTSLFHLPTNYFWDKNKKAFVIKSISRKKMIKRVGGYFETKKIIKDDEIIYKLEFVKVRDVKRKNKLWKKIKAIFQ